jgi:hypothetical protein
MQTRAKLNLIVLYSEAMGQLRDELSAFGFEFKDHQHGQGPVHYAYEREGLCLEIYPASDNNPSTHSRLGISVESMDDAMEVVASINARIKSPPKESPWGIRAVVQLKSGMKLEITQ